MMGERQTDHPALFYEFSLERHVPGDHLLRSIDRFVELGASASSCGRSTAIRADRRSIRS
jgi:hypothetical protein